MIEYDPRPLLYNAADIKFESARPIWETRFKNKGYELGDLIFNTEVEPLPLIPFSQSDSTFEADQAQIATLFRHSQGDYSVLLNLYKNGLPYARERDIAEVNERRSGDFDVETMLETSHIVSLPPGERPAVIVHYDLGHITSLDDIPRLVKAGTAEIIGADRARQIYEFIGSLTTDQLIT